MKFTIKKTRVIRNLFIFVGLLLIGDIISIYLRLNTTGLNEKIPRLIIKLLDFNLEANLPTYFSSLILLINGILLALIGAGYKNLAEKYWQWFGLAAIFVFLALDEMIQIHEQLRAPMEALLNTTGIFYFAWFIPYIIITIILGIAYFKFMMRLPKHIFKYFIIAAVLFISGAVVMEAISGMYSEKHGGSTLAYSLMYTVEESLEMSGSIIFLYALMLYISSQFNNIRFEFVSKN